MRNKLPNSARQRARQAGSVFTVLLAGVAMASALSLVLYQTISGPMSSMVRITNKTAAKAQLQSVSNIVIMDAINQASGGDCDGDGAVEPREWRVGAYGPTGGGLIPLTIGAPITDPWGTDYGYCVWDVGAYNDPTTNNFTAPATGCGAGAHRLKGTPTPSTSTAKSSTVIAIISAGPNRQFQTTCSAYVDDNTDVITTAGDDVVMRFTYKEAASSTSALWTLKVADASKAVISKDLEIGTITPNVSGVSITPTTGLIHAVGITTDGRIVSGGAVNLATDAAVTSCLAGNDGDIRYNTTSHSIEVCNGVAQTWGTATGGSGSSSALSSIMAAVGANTIDNLLYAQVWNWSTLATGTTALTLANTNTAASTATTLAVSSATTGAGYGITSTMSGAAGASVGGYFSNASATAGAIGVYGRSSNTAATATYAIRGDNTGSGNVGAGVYGTNVDSGLNYGVKGSNASTTAGAAGVYGLESNNTATATYGVYGSASGANNVGAGVYGTNVSTTTATAAAGVYADNTSGGWALYVNGPASITGSTVLTNFGAAGVVLNSAVGLLSTLAGTTTTVLHGNAAGLPTFAQVDLAHDVTGVLPAANGGSGGFTQGSVIFADATGASTQDNANFFWDATNHRLGLGWAAAASPHATLDIAGTAQLSNRIRLSGQEYYQAGHTSTDGVDIRLGTNRVGERQIWFADSLKAINATDALIRMRLSGGTYASVDSLSTDGSTPLPLVLNSTGSKVGIGTTAPAALLDVSMDLGAFDDDGVYGLRVTPSAQFNGEEIGTMYGGYFEPLNNGNDFPPNKTYALYAVTNQASYYDSVGLYASAAGSQNGKNYAAIFDQGYVGIGTTAPAYTLDVNGDINISTGHHFMINGVNLGSALSSITAATTTNTIDSLLNAQVWNWSTLATGTTALTLANTNAAASTATTLAVNSATTGAGFGVKATMSGNAAAAMYAISGSNTGAGNTGAGVYGSNASTTAASVGVNGVVSGGANIINYGVYGTNNATGAASTGAGVWGEMSAAGNIGYGVKGTNASTTAASVGVYGVASGAANIINYGMYGTNAATGAASTVSMASPVAPPTSSTTASTAPIMPPVPPPPARAFTVPCPLRAISVTASRGLMPAPLPPPSGSTVSPAAALLLSITAFTAPIMPPALPPGSGVKCLPPAIPATASMVRTPAPPPLLSASRVPPAALPTLSTTASMAPITPRVPPPPAPESGAKCQPQATSATASMARMPAPPLPLSASTASPAAPPTLSTTASTAPIMPPVLPPPARVSTVPCLPQAISVMASMAPMPAPPPPPSVSMASPAAPPTSSTTASTAPIMPPVPPPPARAF
ncbi:MAG: hypothetical protein HY052_04575, partial [Proteobacteria bacterium]|nr:hypothetical protein [Pseudomonadota bacterium]